MEEDSHTEEHEGEGYMENEVLGEWEDKRVNDINGVPLTREIIRFGLSRIARTLDTFEYAYSRLDCRKKNIGTIDDLAKYIHLRLIDLGDNKLKSCAAIAPIQNLLYLNVERNRIESLSEIPDFPFLQALCLRKNKLTSSEGLFSNCLAYLQLADNAIEEIYGITSNICPWLTVLELKGNKVKSIVGIDLPQLQRLYIAENQLTDLNGLDGCPSLTHLHARDNKISHLEGFPALDTLEYVNLRVEVLAANLNLRRLDKEPVLETDLVEARQLRNGREDGTVPGIVNDHRLTAESTSVLDLEEEMQMLASEEEEWQQNA